MALEDEVLIGQLKHQVWEIQGVLEGHHTALLKLCEMLAAGRTDRALAAQMKQELEAMMEDLPKQGG